MFIFSLAKNAIFPEDPVYMYMFLYDKHFIYVYVFSLATISIKLVQCLRDSSLDSYLTSFIEYLTYVKREIRIDLYITINKLFSTSLGRNPAI